MPSTCTPPNPAVDPSLGAPCNGGTLKNACWYAWSCDANGCPQYVNGGPCDGNCPPEPGQPGGLFACFAPGCYVYPNDSTWKCINACWFHSADTCPF